MTEFNLQGFRPAFGQQGIGFAKPRNLFRDSLVTSLSAIRKSATASTAERAASTESAASTAERASAAEATTATERAATAIAAAATAERTATSVASTAGSFHGSLHKHLPHLVSLIAARCSTRTVAAVVRVISV